MSTIGKAKKGVILGGLSGLTWGLDTVLIGIILTMSPFNRTISYVAIAALVGAFIHDSFSSIWMVFYLGKKNKLKGVKKVWKTKAGFIVILASIFGGPIGMTGYLLGVKYAGPAYTASFSAIYPGVGAVFAYFILKEKLSKRAWLGLIISIIGVIFLGYSPIDLSIFPNFKLGIICSMICVFGWSLESVTVAYGMKYGDIDPEIAMLMRQLASSIIYGCIIIPIIAGGSLTLEVLSSKVVYYLWLTALVGTISYLVWYKSIDLIGASRGMALNITYGIWAIAFDTLFFQTPLNSRLLVGSAIIVIGVILVAGNPKEMLEFSEPGIEGVN